MLRLRVDKYCDSVINEIDLFTETKIQSIKTQTEEDWWNKRRQEQIDEIRRIERACLDHVNTLKVEEKETESEEWMKRAFVEYCFTVEFDGLLYLVKANRFVEPKEKRFLDFHLQPRMRFMDGPINNQQSLDVNILKYEVNLRDYFLTDAPVVDISSGIDQCCHIKSACITAIPHNEQSPIFFNLEDLTINECSLGFSIQITEKEAMDVIKCFMTRGHRISTITIRLQYHDHQEPSQDMEAFVQSIRLNNRVKFNFRKFNSSFQKFDLPTLWGKYYQNRTFVSVTNWQFISEISFDRVSLEELENADLSTLHSLTDFQLKILVTGKRSSDWKFLDVCRSSLEHISIKCSVIGKCSELTTPFSCKTFSGMKKLKSLSLSGSFSVDRDGQEQLFGDLAQLERLYIDSTTIPFVISRKRFSGMTNLKSLDLIGLFSVDTNSQEELFADLTQLEKLDIDSSHCTTPFPLSRKTFCSMTNLQELQFKVAFSIETNNPEELFADLIHLKRLVISLDEQALTTKWLIYSPTVAELLLFVKSHRVPDVQIRFKLPQLARLQLSFCCDSIDFDLTDMMSCFSHVKRLEIVNKCYDTMTKGWFNRLTSVEELLLCPGCEGLINSQLFDEFNHLTKLTIYIRTGNSLDRCALHKLVHLESITLVNCTYQENPFDIEDKSMFDGLNSLRTIEFGFNQRSYVYFENLGRFLLVVK